MHLAPLSAVQHLIRVGEPLGFNVRDAEGALLLARGHRFSDDAQLRALLERGAQVDLAELQTARDVALHAPRAALPRLWNEALGRIAAALADSTAPAFRAALDEACAPALALVERDPDLAIFQIVAAQDHADVAYGARRSLHAAIAASLVAQRLAWQDGEVERAFKAALTMNLSMLELQGALARQQQPPSAAQRAELRSHPTRSVQLLAKAGVTDSAWLDAVLQHHEVEDGSGYPSGRSDVCEIASLLRRADVYTSKLAVRDTREALAADAAGRAMFMQDPGHPMTHALVKEFGIYPPGSLVRLASGELAVVVERGPSVTAPVVACLTDARGRSLPAPERRATVDKAHAVVALVPARGVRISAEQLAGLG
jgi:HD-GYP domain-containing protein (c-di-GMP phosphodiesterase class II)